MLTLDWLLERTPEEREVIVRPNGPPLNAQCLRAEVSELVASLTGRCPPRSALAVARTEPGAHLIGILAALESGLVPTVIDAGLDDTARLEIACRAGAVALLLDDRLEPLPWSGSALPPETGMCISTSGSSQTANDRRVIALRGSGVMHNVESILSYLPVARAERIGIVLPLVSAYALIGQALTGLRAGATLILASTFAFPASQLHFLAMKGARGLSSVPNSLRDLARAALDVDDGDRPSLEFVGSAGAELDGETAELLRLAFPKATRFNQYGLTEAGPRVAALSDAQPGFDSGSVGHPLPDVELQVRRLDGSLAGPDEPGELFVRGPGVMAGYAGDPLQTAKVLGPDGFLRTHDLGSIDPDARLSLHGRNDNRVKLDGEFVSLDEVDATLARAPGVDQAHTCVVTDLQRHPHLVAFIASGLPAARILPELRRFARAMLRAHARPVRYIHLVTLPVMGNGKLDRTALGRVALLAVRAAESPACDADGAGDGDGDGDAP